MARRELLRRLRRIERGAIGWRFYTETFTDPETGELWERHVSVSPFGVAASFEAPALCETLEEWTEYAAHMVAHHAPTGPPDAPAPVSIAAGNGAGVLAIPENNGSGNPLR